MKKILILLAIIPLLSACDVNKVKATKVLESQRLTDVQIQGWCGLAAVKKMHSDLTLQPKVHLEL